MDCRNLQGKFTDYVDGDLRPAEGRMLERHLASCPACRQEYEALKWFLDDCHEFLVAPGPAYSFASLRARMAAVKPLEEVVAFLPRLRVHGAIPRYAVALLFMILVGSTPSTYSSTRTLYASIRSPFAQHKERIDEAYEEYLADGSHQAANPGAQQTTHKA